MKNKNPYTLIMIGVFIGILISTVAFNFYKKVNDRETIHKKENGSHISHTNENEHSDEIHLSEKIQKEFGIIVKTAGPGKILLHKKLTGEIVINPYNIAHIIPRFSGIVKKVYKKIGDNVFKGDTIATIESNESLVQYNVTSSINGTIIELHMTPGELIGDDKHVVVVANLNNVWAELSVYQRDLEKIKVGQYVEFSTSNNRGKIKGKIFYVSPIVNETTRTAIARVKLNNRNKTWKPGMFISGNVFISQKNVDIAVPTNAVQLIDNKKIIFVKGKNGFYPQPVKTGITNNTLVEIKRGLQQGNKYIAEGSYTFKSELLKESFGGHEH